MVEVAEVESGSECVVCLCAYDEKKHRPMQMNCGHSICIACANELAKNSGNGTASCPTCRETSYQSSLAPNFALISLIRKSNSSLEERCQGCNVAVQLPLMFYCLTCPNIMEDNLKATEYDRRLLCAFCILRKHKDHQTASSEVFQNREKCAAILKGMQGFYDTATVEKENVLRYLKYLHFKVNAMKVIVDPLNNNAEFKSFSKAHEVMMDLFKTSMKIHQQLNEYMQKMEQRMMEARALDQGDDDTAAKAEDSNSITGAGLIFVVAMFVVIFLGILVKLLGF